MRSSEVSVPYLEVSLYLVQRKQKGEKGNGRGKRRGDVCGERPGGKETRIRLESGGRKKVKRSRGNIDEMESLKANKNTYID